MSERRQHVRVTLDTRVWIGQGGIFTQSDERMSNLSIGGAFIETQAPSYSTGDVLNVRFALGSGFVTATAMVRSARLGGMGIEFLDLSAEGQDAIARYIADAHAGGGR